MLCYAESKSYLKRLAFRRGPTKEILLKCVFKLLNNPSASCSFKNFNFLFSHTAHLIKSLLYRFLSLQCLHYNFFLLTFWLKDQILNLICNLSVFAISSCFFFFFLIINLYILILAIIAQMFTPITELIISLEIWFKKAKSEMEIHTVTAKTKLRKCSV